MQSTACNAMGTDYNAEGGLEAVGNARGAVGKIPKIIPIVGRILMGH